MAWNARTHSRTFNTAINVPVNRALSPRHLTWIDAIPCAIDCSFFPVSCAREASWRKPLRSRWKAQGCRVISQADLIAAVAAAFGAKLDHGKEWRAREDLNLQPLAPEASALSN